MAPPKSRAGNFACDAHVRGKKSYGVFSPGDAVPSVRHFVSSAAGHSDQCAWTGGMRYHPLFYGAAAGVQAAGPPAGQISQAGDPGDAAPEKWSSVRGTHPVGRGPAGGRSQSVFRLRQAELPRLSGWKHLRLAPGMVATTILGSQVSDPGSPGFWAAMGCGFAVALFSFLACGRVVKNHKTAPAPEQDENKT